MSSMDNIKPPFLKKNIGSLHPINQTKDFLLELLAKIGFKIAWSRDREREFNFDMLNIKKSHQQDKCMILFI